MSRKRVRHQRSGAVSMGVAVALGLVDPGMEYFRALTDGEGEAMMLRAQHMIRRNSRA